MALIVCENCGKSCSDTRDKCVHCGASLREDKKSNNERISNLISFDKFDNYKKIQLEKEFLKKNKSAFRYKQKTSFDKFATFTVLFTILYLITYFLLQIFLLVGSENEYIAYDYGVVNEPFAIASIVLAFVAVLVALLWIVIEAVTISFNKNSLKKYVYIKEFQKWLLEKNIEYIPVFDKDSQKEIFEKIDLYRIKL